MIRVHKLDLSALVKGTLTALTCLALAVAMVWPTPTRAQTYSVAELQVILQQILAQLTALQGGQSTMGICPYVWTRSLGQGSTGVDVMRLQQFLNTDPDTGLAPTGVGSKGLETQYYGPLTAAAVSKFQVKYRATILAPLGLVNPTGYFGPASQAEANRQCSSVKLPPIDDDGGPLEGGAGEIEDVELISNINDEEVGEDDEDVEVLGLELTPGGSDIELTAVTLDLEPVDHDEDLEDYAEEVSIWVNGRVYARVDADEFENGDQETITLDRGAIIREDDMGELVVAITGVSDLDSDQEGDEWRATIDSIRFRDALGASVTSNDTDDLSREFSFSEFAEASGLGITVRSGDETINDSRVIEVSDNDDTEGVPVLSFEVEVEGDSDVTIQDLRVSANTGGGDLDDIVSAAYLYLDDDRVGSENISADSGAITFSDIDVDLEADDTYQFEVRFDLREADGSNYDSGATVDVDVTASDLDAWEVEDERGDEVDDSDRRGSASADAHTLRTEGVAVTLVSSDTDEEYNSSIPASSYGEFRMVVDVRAIGETIYVPETATRAEAAENSGLTYHFVDNDGDVYTDGSSVNSFSRISGGSVQSGYVRINEGQTARFELVVTLNPDDFGQYRAQIVSVGWNDTASTPDATSLTLPLSNYDSSYQVISD